MTTSAATGAHRLERTDARRNRRLLLEAAATCVAEKGTSVAAFDIAERAGVSVATLYRRFVTKEALIEAVLLDLLAALTDRANCCLADPDPWDGLANFVVAFARMNKDNHGLSEAIGFTETAALAAPQRRLRNHIRALTRKAQQAGVMRQDVTWQDIAFLPKASHVGRYSIGLVAGDREWERCLTLTLDGLRSPTPSPLPGSPPRKTTGG